MCSPFLRGDLTPRGGLLRPLRWGCDGDFFLSEKENCSANDKYALKEERKDQVQGQKAAYLTKSSSESIRRRDRFVPATGLEALGDSSSASTFSPEPEDAVSRM